MAKRSRGSSKPGQRRPAPARPATRPSSALSVDEEARAAELEGRIVAQERAAEASRSRSRQTTARTDTRRATAQGLLAARSAEEYNYVVRDVRRILVVGGSLAAVMAVLFLLVDVLRVISIS
jgi:hypothetical protein